MRIGRRLLLLVALLVTAAAIVIDLTAGVLIDRAVSERALERLTLESGQLAREIERRWPLAGDEADPWADQAGEALRARVTLVDPSGRVLGDSQVSQRELAGLENHADREEIAQAAVAGLGRSTRVSPSLDRPMHYVARRVGSAASPLAYVRLAVPSAELAAAGRSYRVTLSLITLAALALLGGLAYASVRRVTRPLESIARAADEVASGRYDQSVERESDDEVGDLALSVERMRRTLLQQIGRADAERELLSSILSGLREGILVVGHDHRVLLVNASLRGTLRLPGEVPQGTPFIQVVWDREVVEAFERTLSTGQEVRRRVKAPGGVFELTVVPFGGAGGIGPGAIGLFFNITQIEALERVRREFVADISHELRTPLASLRAAAETLQGGAAEDPEEASRFLGMLIKNTARMESILNDLTDLSLIETGAITLSPAPIQLSGAVREAMAAVEAKAGSRRVDLRNEIPEGLILHADRRRLDQVLVNLLDNAVKFNRAGGSVRVAAAREGDSIRVVVEDTGQGIPPDALERIFHRFYRVDRARSREVPGTGLGLAIVKHLVRLHGGEIHAENTPRAGSRFVLTFPARDAGASPERDI